MPPGPPPKLTVYLADPYMNAVYLYDGGAKTGQSPIGSITGFNEPQGLFVDHKKNLWVANTNGTDILGFQKNHSTPFATLTDPNGYPAGVCGANDGTIYATDISAQGGGDGQTIEVYPPNHTSPAKVLTIPNAGEVDFCAVDNHNNLFVTWFKVDVNNNYTDTEVDEFAHNSSTPTTVIDKPYSSSCLYGIAFAKNNLVVDDACANYPTSGTISTYKPPFTGNPISSFAYNASILEIALDDPAKNLWAANGNAVQGQEYGYPAGALEDATSSSGLSYPVGIAIDPPSN